MCRPACEYRRRVVVLTVLGALSFGASLNGCLGFQTRHARLDGATYPPAVRLTGDAAAVEEGLVSPLVVVTPSDVKGTQRDGFGGWSDSDGPFTLSAPRVLLGVSGETGLAGDRLMRHRLVLSGGILGGRGAGRWSWSTDGAVGARFHPFELGLRFDLGLRARDSRYDVSYVETYTEDDSSRSTSGRIRGSSVLLDPYVALAINSRRPGDALNTFVSVDLGLFTTLDFDMESELVDGTHDVSRGAVGLFVTYGLFRRLSPERRALVGLRVGHIGGGAAAQLFVRLDRLHPPDDR